MRLRDGVMKRRQWVRPARTSTTIPFCDHRSALTSPAASQPPSPPAQERTARGYPFVVATIRTTRVGAAVTMVAVLCVATGVLIAKPARASCVGPQLTPSATTVSRGETITIVGEAWGTDCNDTNQNPDEGSLGAPATDIIIEFAQGPQRIVVAKGNASSRYSFTVQVKVPSILKPGPVNLAGDFPTAFVQLTVSDAAPAGTTAESVVRFGPVKPAKAPPISDRKPDPQPRRFGSTAWWVTGAILLLVVQAVVRRIVTSQRHRQA